MVSVAVVGSGSGGPAAPPPPGGGCGTAPGWLYVRVTRVFGRVEHDIWEVPGRAVPERVEGPAGLALLGPACAPSPPKPDGWLAGQPVALHGRDGVSKLGWGTEDSLEAGKILAFAADRASADFVYPGRPLALERIPLNVVFRCTEPRYV